MNDERLPQSVETGPPVSTSSVLVESPADVEATDVGIDADGALEELELPSLVSAPEPLAPGTEIGLEGRLRVGEHVGTRGRVNLYAATWRQDEGQEIEVDLREGPADHVGLQREAEVL